MATARRQDAKVKDGRSFLIPLMAPLQEPWAETRQPASRSSGGPLEPTPAQLTVSSWTTKRLLRMWLAPPVAHLPNSLARRCTDGMKRTSYCECKGLRAGRLDQHSMHSLENRATHDVPTRWRRSASSTVTTTTRAGWPPGDDHRSHVRAGLSLPLLRSAVPVA